MKKMYEKEELAKKVFGENEKEVLDFLKKENSDKRTFQNEKSLVNYTSRLLVRELQKKIRLLDRKDILGLEFLSNRKKALVLGRVEDKPKNIIYAIHVLNGTVAVPRNEPEYDFESDPEIPQDDEERFWEAKEKEREGWIY